MSRTVFFFVAVLSLSCWLPAARVLAQDADDAIVNTSTTGGDIWTGGDDFNFDYAELSGDFDVSVEIFNYTHSTGAGRWGKLGLMARRELTRDSEFVMTQIHGPGNEDHDDGIVRRYTEASFNREADVPSHLVLDSTSGWLYYANTGDGTVVRLDTRSGENDGQATGAMEALEEYSVYADTTVETFATGFEAPSGIAIHNDRIFVSDNATGEIIAFDLDGSEIDRMETGAESLMGIDIGPSGQLWFVDAEANTVTVIKP